MRPLLDFFILKIPSVLLRLVLLCTVISAPTFALLANFDSFEPYLFPLHYLQGNVRSVTNNVLVGHYPDYGLLSELDQRGVKIVISLLNDKLVYEKPLIRQEVAYSRQLGLRGFNFKMDSQEPATSPMNRAAMDNIKKVIALNPRSKIYIHCYFGKHRTGYVEEQLRAVGVRTASAGSALDKS